MIIQSPSNRTAAEVNSKNRLETASVSTEVSVDSILSGDGYEISSGTVTLTNAAESGIIYYENREDRNLVVIFATLSLGNPVGATDDFVTFRSTVGNNVSMTGGTGVPADTVNLVVGNQSTLDNDSEIFEQFDSDTVDHPPQKQH